jgi:hypothetical protein
MRRPHPFDLLLMTLIVVVIAAYAYNVFEAIRLVFFHRSSLVQLLRIPVGATGAYLLGMGAWRRTTWSRQLEIEA